MLNTFNEVKFTILQVANLHSITKGMVVSYIYRNTYYFPNFYHFYRENISGRLVHFWWESNVPNFCLEIGIAW